ncbi:MAG TPA: TonB-dependent receptor, partial [Acidobacteriaceae bacterium]
DAYIHIVGVGDSDSSTNHVTSALQQWNIRDTFSLQARNHLLKFGIDQRHVSASLTPAALSVQADFFDRNSMVTNSASDIVITKSSPANPVLDEFSAFVEDEWKVSKALNLSMGLRWDVNPAPKGQHGQDAYTVLGDINAPATLQLAPRGTPLWDTSWYNLAPRLGAAWVVKNEPGRELILRAGGGVFFDTGTQPALEAFQGIGFATSAYYTNAPIPVTPSQLTFSTAVAPPYTNAKVFAFSPHLPLPYTFQWNIGVEKALGKDQSITVSYVGANGRRLLNEQRRNVSRLNPNFGDVVYFPSGLTSSYQSLQAKFQRSLSHGVEALVSYTWAHSLDYGSTDPAFPLVRGNSDLDVRHNLEAAASWDFSPPGKRWLSFKRLVEGWGADGRLIARTGFPVNLLGNFFFDPLTGSPYYSGVDLIPGRPLYVHNAAYPGHRIFSGGPNVANPAFRLPVGMDAGDAPRNLLRGFGALQTNAALRQDFHLHDRMNLQFKAEIFNLFNHPNFGYIDPHLSDLLFGQSTKMLNQSFGAAGALYDQGGPRAIQLSLKLVF